MALPPAPAGYDIELDDVVFGYREGQPILQVLAVPIKRLDPRLAYTSVQYAQEPA